MAGALLKYNGQALQTPSGAYGINNLVPENVKSGVNIGGVVGTFSGDNPPSMTTTARGASGTATTLIINNVNFVAKEIWLNSKSPAQYKVAFGHISSTEKIYAYAQTQLTFAYYENSINFTQSGTTLTISTTNGNRFANYPANEYIVTILG